ncbi:kinase-like protein [Nemania abortiva]|nr:kinase-like protein [Nemania abortiva]
MAALVVDAADYSASKRKALEEADEIGRDLPPYAFLELIGRGSCSRVYKALAASAQLGRLVAIKVISIEARDSLDPGSADTFGDIMKEINMLKLLGTTGAKNINTIAMLFSSASPCGWMVTEYCAGGSVASLMRPTGCLPEKSTVPILREVAEAIYWVHKQGIIHRDIKCANVLITDAGDIQLSGFGVVAVAQTRPDKRTTVTGTSQRMASELLSSAVSYGAEVDIWAFGSMAYEVVSGLPPNAITAPDIPDLNAYLKLHCPRLEGDHYSPLLRDFVFHCLVVDPEQRPMIDVVRKHPYIFGTSDDYPTSSLSELVGAYKAWEMKGEDRRPLFYNSGAQSASTHHTLILSEQWHFDTSDASNEITPDSANTEALGDDSYPQASSPSTTPSSRRRRRRRSTNIKLPTTPLEKVFGPSTLSNYQDNVRSFYNRSYSQTISDLPLRDSSTSPALRESLIDLDSSLNSGQLSQFTDIDTIQARPRHASNVTANVDQQGTRDWALPATATASASLHSPLFPYDYPTGQITPNTPSTRDSFLSLIDLNAGLPGVTMDATPPNSDTEDEHLEFKRPALKSPSTNREPSLYASSANYSYSSFNSLGTDPYSTLAGQPGDPSTPRVVSEPGAESNEALSLPPPDPPSPAIMQGTSSRDELKEELQRITASFNEHLQFTAHIFRTLPNRREDPDSAE